MAVQPDQQNNSMRRGKRSRMGAMLAQLGLESETVAPTSLPLRTVFTTTSIKLFYSMGGTMFQADRVQDSH